MPTLANPENIRISDHRGVPTIERRNAYNRETWMVVAYVADLETLKSLHSKIGKYLVERSRA